MKKKQQTFNWAGEGLMALIGIIILLAITQFMCKKSNEFCSFEYKVFAVVIILVLFAIRYFLREKN
jgi:hypothetical protein